MQLPDQARYTGHSELDDRIAGAHRTIEEVFAAVRSPGLSYAVVQDGELLTSAHLGYRDVERKTKADDDTIYSLASMTKAIIAILIGQLVHESLLDWQTPIEKIIPEFRCQTPEDGSLITIIDLLTHRTGIFRSCCLVPLDELTWT